MENEAVEEAVEKIQKCVKWSQGWAEANPDPVVADAVENGLVTLGCLSKARLKRMLENEALEPQDLSESQMAFLGRMGLLDPEAAETVDGDDGEHGGGGVSLDDLDPEEVEDLRERVREEVRANIEERMGDDGEDQEEETELNDFGGEKRDDDDELTTGAA